MSETRYNDVKKSIRKNKKKNRHRPNHRFESSSSSSNSRDVKEEDASILITGEGVWGVYHCFFPSFSSTTTYTHHGLLSLIQCRQKITTHLLDFFKKKYKQPQQTLAYCFISSASRATPIIIQPFFPPFSAPIYMQCTCLHRGLNIDVGGEKKKRHCVYSLWNLYRFLPYLLLLLLLRTFSRPIAL